MTLFEIMHGAAAILARMYLRRRRRSAFIDSITRLIIRRAVQADAGDYMMAAVRHADARPNDFKDGARLSIDRSIVATTTRQSGYRRHLFTAI